MTHAEAGALGGRSGLCRLSALTRAEAVMRWRMGESQRTVARALGIAQDTVSRWCRAEEGR
jgi:transposase-like protein